MTARDALADGRLDDAVRLQQAVVDAQPDDPAARLFLFELLVLCGELVEADEQLAAIPSADADWPDARRALAEIVTAEGRRTPHVRRPTYLLDRPAHTRRRWNAAHFHRRGDGAEAARWLDRADAATPEVSGFVDGREFTGLRDADDRFASLFEVFIDGRCAWLPFEQVRSLTLEPAAHVLDTAFRPCRVELTDGRTLRVTAPLVYPDSARHGDDAALGNMVDWTSADAGLVCGIGARVLTFGDEEVEFGTCRMIELRPAK